MENTEKILKKVRISQRSAAKIIDIRRWINDAKHRVVHISADFSFAQSDKPYFSVMYWYGDLTAELRESMIDLLLESEEETGLDEFDVESHIYTEEQQKKLAELRSARERKDVLGTRAGQAELAEFNAALNEYKREYSLGFAVGDKVHYNGYHGTITFRHQDDPGKEALWSVRVGDTEYRYVSGALLTKRRVEDLSHIEKDAELDKLSTEKLLKMYKRKRDMNRGRGDKRIKRILNEREHIQTGPTKTVILPH
jgi:hypothetical protein